MIQNHEIAVLAKKQKSLLDSLKTMQSDFLKKGVYFGWCKNTFENLLLLTESKFGLISELMQKDDGTPYMKSHAITNIAWDKETRQFYDKNVEKGLEFFDFDNLVGAAINTGKAVISNDPDNDPRRGGYPKEKGHPKLECFLGLPIKDTTGKVVGVMGVANRPAGYNQDIVDFIDPFVSTYGFFIEKSQEDKKRQKIEEELRSTNARLLREIDERKRVEKEKELVITKLSEALENVKLLRGLLPICANCKKIRDDKGYWNQIESYIEKHSDAQFSHGICEECAEVLYADSEWYKKRKQK